MKIKSLFLLAFLSISVLASSAHARNFYRTGFSLGASYTNIRTGSKDLFSGSVNIVYSDDADFCFIQLFSEESPCKIVSFDGIGATEPIISLPKDFIVKAFIKISDAEDSIGQIERSAVKRLITKYPNELTKMNWTSYYGYQLHDEQPEAIHIWISSLKTGQRM